MASSLKNMKQSKTRDRFGAVVQESAHAPPSTWDTGVNVKTPGVNDKLAVINAAREHNALIWGWAGARNCYKEAVWNLIAPLLTKNPPSVRKNSQRR
jgi:hypothetical protein